MHQETHFLGLIPSQVKALKAQVLLAPFLLRLLLLTLTHQAGTGLEMCLERSCHHPRQVAHLTSQAFLVALAQLPERLDPRMMMV